jgi:hypothetical protein
MAAADTMYRCMLNKRTEAPTAVQVPIDSYSGNMGSRYTTRLYVKRGSQQQQDDPPDAFVLFHRDLCDACMERGVLDGSRPHAMWRAIARNIETYDPNAETEADAAAVQPPPR